MAEKVLFNVAGGILGSLAGPLVAEEIRLLFRADGELEKLTDTVSAIRAVLLDAEERQSQSRAVSLWLERLSDVLYEADDLLDAVATEVRRREIMTQDKKAKEVRIFFSKSNQLAFRRKMGHKIKAIRERLDAIKADRDFHLEERIEETPVMVTGRDDTYSFVLKQHVIGREDDTEKVIRSLLDIKIEKSLSILPIVGIGGLGKTTLAQLVFNDERMQNFDLKMWVCVSDNFNVRNIVEKILKSAKVKLEGDEIEQLVDCLRKEIVSKKFFLVLDDVWNENHEKWFELKNLLTNDVVGSKILITTRSNEVARITYTIEPYMLKGLREEESWNLFKKMAFDGKEPENSSVREIGEEIMRKCGGLPLALGVMGRMLSGQNSIEAWEAFRNYQLSKISENTILSTLKLSYDILPSHLKHCFVYCSLFPKNYEFNKTMLIRLWIAQGFVKLEENRFLEDIGHDYLMELVSRLFFQKDFASLFSLEEDIYVFKMHDLMHDLATLMARSLIVTKLDNRENIIQKAHHISFQSLNHVSSLYKKSRTRTLIYFGYGEFSNHLDVEKVVSSFKLLRVLVLGNIFLGLNNIDSLIHLRYLDLSGNWIFELPNSITKLINLETLILFGCSKLQKLPKCISKLVNLRHLDNSDCFICHLSHEILQLTNLQTLGLFCNYESSSEHDFGFEEIIGLKNLRGKINFYDERSHVHGTACYTGTVVDPKVKSIFNVLKLDEEDYLDSSIARTRTEEQTSQGQFSRWSLSFLPTLTSLVVLTIKDVRGCKHLSPLCQLPSLEEVNLFRMDNLEYIIGYSDKNQLSSLTPSKTFFPSLKFLQIDECDNLRGWLWIDSPTDLKVDNSGDNSVVEHHLPPMFSCLSKFSISHSLLLASMPLFADTLEDLSSCNVKWKPYPMPTVSSASATITSYPLGASLSTHLSKLKKLRLNRVKEIETLQMERLQYFTSLENLTIHFCTSLKYLCLESLHLTALKSLRLLNCPELEFVNDKDAAHWQGLENLHTVHFTSLPNLMFLPRYLQNATALVDLRIEYCQSLTSLPEWICNYKSLKELRIVKCSSLKYLPEGVETLPSLDRINIWGCPGIRNTAETPGKVPPI